MKLKLNSNNLKRGRKLILVLVLGLIFVSLVIGVRGSMGFLDNEAAYLVSFAQAPFIELTNRITSFWQVIVSLQAITNENSELRDENLRLLSEAARVVEYKKENDFLRASLDLEPREPLRFTVGRIVGQEFSGFSNTITIDKGLKDGIEEGMAVVLTERILIGSVVEVRDDLSYVRLLADPQTNLAAVTLETQTEGLLRGDFGSTLVLDEITKDNLIFLGELVLSSGKDGNFPANFIAGRIRDIKFSESGLFKQAIVEPIVDLDKLYQVLIMLDS